MKFALRPAVVLAALVPTLAHADENLFGYVAGAEPLPQGALELYGRATLRADKGQGEYQAWDLSSELEYGVTPRLAAAIYLHALAIDTSGLQIDGYLPGDKRYGPRLSGVETSLKYNFLSPAKDVIGLSSYTAFNYAWLDRHSGYGKDSLSFEQQLLAQKYFLDAQLIAVGNVGIEATHARRDAIDGLPAGFDWPTTPEMEIEVLAGAGLSYRFMPNWFAGVEAHYEEEHETEVGLERWSLQAGPSLHFGAQRWWTTLTWMPQLRGGGEQYAGQTDPDHHLIEKTRQEYRLKIGFNL